MVECLYSVGEALGLIPGCVCGGETFSNPTSLPCRPLGAGGDAGEQENHAQGMRPGGSLEAEGRARDVRAVGVERRQGRRSVWRVEDTGGGGCGGQAGLT